MIPSTLWQRYILRELLKIFFLFLGCFFLLYSLVDYSLHMKDFVNNHKIQFSHIATYYLFQFVKRADLLLPLSLLISTLKTLLTLNTKGELIALRSAGLSPKQILRPFWWLAIFCTFFSLLNFECFLPSSLDRLDTLRKEHFKQKRIKAKEPIHVLTLKDDSKIFYKEEDLEQKLYRDVFWICSFDEVWRMSTLSTDLQHPVGFFVDRLKRNVQGEFEKIASFDQYYFPKFRPQADPKGKGYLSLENRKLSQLLRLSLSKKPIGSYEHIQVLTHLLFKAAMPLLSLIMVAASAPFCLKHARSLPTFFIYSIALFSFITFFTLMDAAMILGENGVVSPYTAILSPIALLALLFTLNYHKRLKGII